MKKILIIDDNKDVLLSIKLLLKRQGFSCFLAASPAEAMLILDHEQLDIILQDMNFKLDTTSGLEGLELLKKLKKKYFELPVILFSAWANIDVIVQGMKLGADNFFIKPWDNDKLLQLINDTLILKPVIKTETVNKEINDEFPSIIGKSPRLISQLKIAKMVAATDANILITGENGTGKDLLAKEIHQLSKKKAGPFIKVNIGGLKTSLFESELFGHEKGAYTDAKEARKGRFEEADQGSIFLDEIGDLPFDMQVKLLRVIQDGQFERLGSNKTLSVDVRILSATNANLVDLIDTNQFREDLFYRLNTIEIHLPALRDRGTDVLLLAQFFIEKFNKKYQKSYSLSEANNSAILNYSWPGNIRELEHSLERAVLTSQKELEINLKKKSHLATETDTLDVIEKKTILNSLAENNNNISHTAKQLGITRNALYRRLQKFEIDLE